VTDQSGTRYLLQAAPSGFVPWSVHTVQGPVEYCWYTLGTAVARLVFRGGWTLVAWQGDVYAPKRTAVRKVRCPAREPATAESDRLAVEIERTGLQPSVEGADP